jgi:CHAT domain-containing protein/tetratricopeptide (TPR) repeat protein
MPRILIVCLAGWLAAAAGAESPAPLTQERQEKFKERDRFQKEAEKLQAEGKLPEAIAAAEKMLAIERELLGSVHPDVAMSLEFLADLHEAREVFPAARKARQEVLAIQTKLRGAQHWQVTDARLALQDVERLARMAPADRRRLAEAGQLSSQAVELYEQGKAREAIPLAQKALDTRQQLLGERHPDCASSLNNLAVFYKAQGEYAKAEPLLRRASTIDKEVLGERHPTYATALNNLAELYRDQGAYAQAEPVYRQALELRKEVLGERHPDYAQSLSNLAGLYHLQGKYAQAEPLFRQALDLRKELLGERHPAYATTLNKLAQLYEAQGKYAQAEPLYRQTLAICKEVLGERHPNYALSLNNLAGLYEAQGEYAKAELLFRQSLEITKQVLGERHPDHVTCLNNLAGLYQSQGEYAQAEPLLRQVRDTRRQVLGERHPDYATALNNLAQLYEVRGEYAQAESLYREAAGIFKQVLGEWHPDYALSLNNLAALYQAQGEYDLAEPLYCHALAIRKRVLGERHPDYAISLHNLAALYRDQRDYAQAEPLQRQALEITRQVLGARHPVIANQLNDLALLYDAQGKAAQAEPLYRQALAIRKEALGEHHPDYASSLNNLAILYQAQGDYTRAEPLYRQAIAVLRRQPEGPATPVEKLTPADLRPLPDTVKWLANYAAFVEQRLGDQPTARQLRAAERVFDLALGVRERLRQEVLSHEASKLHHGAETGELVPRRIGLCQRLFKQEGRTADLESALAVAEQGSARVFLEQLGKARALTVGRVSPALRQQEAGYKHKLGALDAQIAKEQDKPPDQRDLEAVARLLEQQSKVELQLTELIQRVEKDFPHYAALKYPRPCSVTEACACLAATEVALLFVPGNHQSYVVLVEGRPARKDKAEGLAIYALPSHTEIADGISCLTDADTLALPVKVRAAAEQAYGLLLAPLKERLRDKDLVIVPSGPLCYLPFEALIEDGQYLIERHRIRYAPSLTALHLVRQWQATRAQPEQPLFAVGDAIYDAHDIRLKEGSTVAEVSRDAQQEVRHREGGLGSALPRLEHSGREVRAIAQLLHAPSRSVLTGKQALEATVKQLSATGALKKARYVHFATHGILGLDTGQPPALVLSLVGNDGQRDAEGGLNDGFLRLDEVTRLKLNADLVVLSACRTGQGRLYAGEGVTGLARAFLYAGSRGVVCSLWAVDDRETAILMTRLYAGLKDGQAAADALRAAKLEMIRERKAPVYWAPFILIGE